MRALSDDNVILILHWWDFWVRDDQRPPPGKWRVWLFLGGRGAGKTRAGAEWLHGEILEGRANRVALVGPTMNDVREVMITGPSGLMNIGHESERPVYEPSRRRLCWPNGAVGYAFSAEEPDRLRGPQFDAAWLDELAAWDRGESVFDMLQFGLRLGAHPRLVATTTPKPNALIKRLVGDENVKTTRGKSALNTANLAPGFLEAMRASYGHGELARQELDGELIEAREGALFALSTFDQTRVKHAPDLDALVIAVDPPAMAKASSDACGIIAVGKAGDEAFVLGDASVQGVKPEVWAGRVADLALTLGADEVIAEANQGGEMVRSVLKTAGVNLAIRLVHARHDKRRRAAPVAALYSAGRVHHVGHFRELEDEMLAFGNVDKFLLGSELRGLTRLRDEAGAYPAVEQLIALASEVRSILGPAVEISYAADWTEYGAYVPEDGSGDVLFPLDAFWSDANVDFIGLDWYAPLSDWRDGEHLDSALFPAIDDPAYLAANIEGGEGYDWYYASAADRDAQTRTPITDTAHGEDWVFRVKDIRSWWQNTHFERPVGARAVSPTQFIPASKPIRLIEIGCGAVDKGSNAPNVFIDPKSAESGLPHYSDGTRDDDIQRASILAIYDYWAENAPLSPIYGEAMIPADGLSVWCFDARPFPAFPARSDLWSDGANWKTGHWLNGRLSTSPLGAIIEEVCGNSVNVGAVNGHVPGYAVSGLSTVRVLDPLAFAFSLTCRQSEAGLVFSNQPNGAAKQISFADYALEKREFSALTLKRDVTEHGPKGVRVTVSDPSSDYQPVSVHVGDAPEGDRDLHIRLPMALDETGTTDLAAQIHGRVNADKTSQTLNISPARDDVTIGDLLHVEGETLRVNGLERRGHIRVTLGYAEAAFAGAQSLPQTGSTAAHSPQPDLVVLDIPNMPGSEDDIRPLVGAFAHPWAGEINVSAGASSTSLSKRASLSQPAMIGRLLTPLPSGPGDRWRPGVSLDIRFPDAALAARDRVDVLNGANLIAVETNGGWMLACFQTAEMLSGDVWRISGLLTGLSGTEDLSTLGAEAGARLVIIDQALIRAELSAHELGTDLLWQAKGPGGLAEAETVALKLEGRAKSPLRPGHLRAETLAGGDIHLSWTRRARHSADRLDTSDVPLLEEALLFRVEVFAGEVLLRSEDVSDTVWVYSVNDQMNDAVNGAELRFRVVQVSPSYGDGVSAECVLT